MNCKNCINNKKSKCVLYNKYVDDTHFCYEYVNNIFNKLKDIGFKFIQSGYINDDFIKNYTTHYFLKSTTKLYVKYMEDVQIIKIHGSKNFKSFSSTVTKDLFENVDLELFIKSI